MFLCCTDGEGMCSYDCARENDDDEVCRDDDTGDCEYCNGAVCLCVVVVTVMFRVVCPCMFFTSLRCNC